ncbi:MAG: hypothetical protein OEV60_07150 [Actinomycetota bacterium]|nr:hypothetical protein [Actinomycetota bacterium]MDH5225286.1 hypothetical protein [Actinomycetota bacterium]MDH5312709.1 hypothetical protein [Actinomycetota bacterium]
MRKVTFFLVVALLVSAAATALAAGPVTRNGANYSGVRNPGGCEVFPEKGTQLHVKCVKSVGADGAAFVRYRFLKDVGGVVGPATVSAVIRDNAGCSSYRWMGPIRTMRIMVPFGCYVHVVNVTWQQP